MTALAQAARELPSADEVQGAIREITASGEFASADQGTSSVGEWILEKLNQLWEWFVEVGQGSPWRFVVVFAVILAVVAIVWTVVSRHAPRLRGRTRSFEERELPMTSEEWFARAAKLAEEGEWRQAASAVYRGSLLILEKRGYLSFHSSKTPGDYIREIGRGSGSSAVGFIERFQVFSFGAEPPNGRDYRTLIRAARESGCLTAAVSSREKSQV